MPSRNRIIWFSKRKSQRRVPKHHTHTNMQVMTVNTRDFPKFQTRASPSFHLREEKKERKKERKKKPLRAITNKAEIVVQNERSNTMKRMRFDRVKFPSWLLQRNQKDYTLLIAGCCFF